MNDIPDWAVRVFCERASLSYLAVKVRDDFQAHLLWRAVSAGARLIAKHEQPPADPVDPDEEAVKRILAAHDGFPVEDTCFAKNCLARAVSQYKQEKANG